MENKYLDSLSDDEFGECIHIEKTNTNTSYFIIDDFISNYNKIFDLYLVKYEFEVEFINFTDFIKSEYFSNTSIVIMKKYLIYHIYLVISRGFNFSIVSTMKNKTLNKKSYMNYNYYIKQTMPMIEQRLNISIFKKSTTDKFVKKRQRPSFKLTK